MAIDEGKLNALLGKMVTELGAAFIGTNVLIGDQLGLYRTLAAGGALTSHQLAERTGTAERYVREWLAGQAASGYIDYDAEGETFSLSPEQALVFANADSPALMMRNPIAAAIGQRACFKLPPQRPGIKIQRQLGLPSVELVPPGFMRHVHRGSLPLD